MNTRLLIPVVMVAGVACVGLAAGMALADSCCPGSIPGAAAGEGPKGATRPAETKPAPAVAKIGQTAPAFVLTDHQGRKVSLADYAGKIVVLEWINPDCPYVQRHYKAGTMKALAERYAPKGVIWLAVNSTHYYTPDKSKAWAETYKLPYPILDDRSGEVGRMYEAKTTPDIRIIDAAGKLAYSGAIDDDPDGRNPTPANHVAKALDELLAGQKVTTQKTRPYGCSVKYAPKPTSRPATAPVKP